MVRRYLAVSKVISIGFIFCVLTLSKSIRGFDEVKLEDISDSNYDIYAEMKKQALVDRRIKTTLHTIAKADGYDLETHYTQSEDGYILAMHRIPYSPTNRDVPNKPVVFLGHGLFSCSLHFLIPGPGKALPYLLAERGYDVWLGNGRGNSFSKNHTKLDPKQKEFWQFSWHEIGYYDLPAMIDYALNKTRQETLQYIGHSQGTTTFFVMAATRAEYNKKIRAMHALAPAAFMSNINYPLFRILGPLVGGNSLLTNAIGPFEFLPSSKLTSTLGKKMCKDDLMAKTVCSSIYFSIGGYSPDTLDISLLPRMLENTPAGSSVNQVIHYTQGIASGKFRKFDFGMAQNYLTYGAMDPPNYDIKKITAPIHLHYAPNDFLVSEKDVNKLANLLPNLVYRARVRHPTFGHLDFVVGSKVYDLVFRYLLENMKKFS